MEVSLRNISQNLVIYKFFVLLLRRVNIVLVMFGSHV